MNFFDHKDLGNHLLQLCPKVVKQPAYYLPGELSDWMSRKHEVYWQSISRKRQAKDFLYRPSAQIATENYLSRNQLRIMTGLLSGHCNLKGHLLKLGWLTVPSVTHANTYLKRPRMFFATVRNW